MMLPPPPALVEAVILLTRSRLLLSSWIELELIVISPAVPVPGGILGLLLEKLPTLIVAPSRTVTRSLVILMFPPSPLSTIALANKPLRPKSLNPNNSTFSALIAKFPAFPEPEVLTAICAPSVTCKVPVSIIKFPPLPTPAPRTVAIGSGIPGILKTVAAILLGANSFPPLT